MNRQAMLIFATASFFPVPATASPADDATAAVTNWIDKFNAGDFAAFHAGHAQNVAIVDEFAPHFWSGVDAPKKWFDDYVKSANAGGITAGHLDYAAPIQATANASTAYIVLPTIYSYQQAGKKRSAAGTMTFVMTRVANEWKIASWTYSAPAPR